MRTMYTMATLNSCTKCVGSPGIIYNCTLYFLGMDDLTTKHSFDLQAIWVIGVLGLFFGHVTHVSL